MRITVRPPFRVDKSWISRICRRNGLKRTQSAFPERRGLKPYSLRKGRPGKAHGFSCPCRLCEVNWMAGSGKWGFCLFVRDNSDGIHNCFLMVSSTISLVICLIISLKSLLQSRAPPGRASPLPLTLGISVSGNPVFGNIGTNIRKSWELMHV